MYAFLLITCDIYLLQVLGDKHGNAVSPRCLYVLLSLVQKNHRIPLIISHNVTYDTIPVAVYM